MDDAMKTAADTSAWLRQNGYGEKADALDSDVFAFASTIHVLSREPVRTYNRPEWGLRLFKALGYTLAAAEVALILYIVYVWMFLG